MFNTVSCCVQENPAGATPLGEHIEGQEGVPYGPSSSPQTGIFSKLCLMGDDLKGDEIREEEAKVPLSSDNVSIRTDSVSFKSIEPMYQTQFSLDVAQENQHLHVAAAVVHEAFPKYSEIIRHSDIPVRTSIPIDLDLPASVVTSKDQMGRFGLKPSIFALENGLAATQTGDEAVRAMTSISWFRNTLQHGIPVQKVSRKNGLIKPRTLHSNLTFTMLTIRGGGPMFKWFGPEKVFRLPTAEIHCIYKGKASPELQNIPEPAEGDATGIPSDRCLVIRTNKRSCSFVWESVDTRDRCARAFEELLRRESYTVEDYLKGEPAFMVEEPLTPLEINNDEDIPVSPIKKSKSEGCLSRGSSPRKGKLDTQPSERTTDVPSPAADDERMSQHAEVPPQETGRKTEGEETVEPTVTPTVEADDVPVSA